ncbi:polysaccharide pyruvyl transferase family protein [Nodosilinea sp. PGN35]|uniref:polysaccharide pyruvyl transferase family protein n=1 Tax=Nodosilinea sp. PGN35 TaxID=3020489 RepID=UPI0023B2AA48|nr:polysaccharide pyruvyl transferase family protein [Nodosilinea sp. TSF1-S3]MDF0367313.1 polysaccharide pyruvyl transferase family protein [Nodosilinea sp. TSF1-S3]
MKAAVWGSYNYGNYGDDIMALQFAQTLNSNGLQPWVYRLNRDVASRFQIHSTDSIDELLEQAEFCLIGGGAMLESGPSEMDLDFEDLTRASARYHCPVFPVSVGGDGQGILSRLSPQKKAFWTSDYCQNPTVRLTSDVALAQLLDKQATYYPDVLWTVKDAWGIEPKQNADGKMHVGINIPNSAAARLMVQQLSTIAAVRRDIVFHFIRTYLPTSPVNLELMPKSQSPFIRQHVYTDPKETLEFLSSLNLVISHKLHLGLTALALGVPFLSLGGKGKTKTFLREIGADFAIFSSRKKNTELVALLSSRKKLNQFGQMFDWSLIQQLQQISSGHLNHVKAIATDLGAEATGRKSKSELLTP